jgi:hypothetical protein
LPCGVRQTWSSPREKLKATLKESGKFGNVKLAAQQATHYLFSCFLNFCYTSVITLPKVNITLLKVRITTFNTG